MIKTFKSWQGIVLTTLFLIVLFYVGQRAYFVSFSHDEALSFRIINGDNDLRGTANHHILNTWLMKLCNVIFGASELSLRLPSLLGLVLFFVGLMKVLFNVKQKNFSLMLLAFSVALLNPYVLDFFALARGYGLGLGFAMLSFAYFLAPLNGSIESLNSKSFKVLGFMILAVYANLTYINYFLLLLVLIGVDYYRLLKKTDNGFATLDKRYYLYRVIGIAVLVTPAFSFLFYLKNNGQLYFGGEQGIISNTLNSLILRSHYFADQELPFFSAIQIVVIAIFFAGIGFQFLQRKYNRFSALVVLICMYFIILNIQFYGLEARFPQTRTALFLIPLFSIFLYSFLVNLLERFKKWLSYLVGVLSIFLVGFLIYHFMVFINFEASKEWQYDGGTKEAHQLYSELKKEGDTVSYDWLVGPSWCYYEYLKNDLEEIPKESRAGINPESDFVYCSTAMKDSLVDKGWFKIVKEFEIPRMMFLQKVKN